MLKSGTAKDTLVVIAVSGATSLNAFVSGTLPVALPTIGRDLGFREVDLQWPANVFALAYACLLLFFGRVGDILGSRAMFIAGTAWFTAWSIAAAFAPNKVAFIIFVALQGMGAAANTPAGIGLLTAHFPSGSGRNRALGLLGACQPLGGITGVVLGGAITQSKPGWPVLFYVQAGLGLIFLILGCISIPNDDGNKDKRYSKGIDWSGAVLSTAGFAMLTYSLADAVVAVEGWKAPQVPTLLSLSILFLGFFIFVEQWRERRDLSVLIPISLFSRSGAKLGRVLVVAFFAWWVLNTILYLLTLYYQQVLLLTPIQNSIRFFPMAITEVIVSVATGFVMNRVSGQVLLGIGLTGATAAPIIFALIDIHASFWSMAFIVTITVGGIAAYPIGNLHITSHFDGDSQSLAGGVFAVTTRLGTSIGLTVSSSVATAISKQYAQKHDLPSDAPEVILAGFRAGAWACASAGGFALLICVFGLRGIGIVAQQKKEDSTAEETGSNLEKHKGLESQLKSGAVGDTESSPVPDSGAQNEALPGSAASITSVAWPLT